MTRAATTALLCSFAVPGQIVPWARSRTGNGHHFTAPKVASYQGALRAAAFDAMQGREPFDGPCRIRIDAVFAVPASWSAKRKAAASSHAGRPDWDNVGKAVSDSLNGIVWTDDARVADARVVKTYGTSPGLFVEVWSLADEPLCEAVE